MKHFGVLAIALGGVVLAGCGGGGGVGGGDVTLDSFEDSASYAVGIRLAAAIRERNAAVATPAVLRGLRDALEGTELQLTPEQTTDLVQRLTDAGYQEEAQSNATAGAAYREQEAKRDGVQQTESGILYEVLKPGSGSKPAADARVRVHYVGTLVDGTEFDSSRKRGEPAVFALNGVISGWTEAVQLMPVGSTYRFVIPPELGYGERGLPPSIPPNATLIFEVELLGIEK